MNIEKRSTGFGAAIIVFAIVVRMVSGGMAGPQLQQTDRWENLLEYLQGGSTWLPAVGAMTKPESTVPTQPEVTMGSTTAAPTQPEEPTPPEPTVPELPAVPVFSGEDLQRIQIYYGADCLYRPDLQTLLLKPLQWDLTALEPTVLIIHTHTSECYTRQPGQSYTQTAAYRTLDEKYNMVAVGDLLAQLLQAGGITVLHDRTVHDYPSYQDAYSNSRLAAQEYLRQYPSIQVVLDLHRDSMLNADGSQYATKATVDGKEAAQLMLVLGTDASGNYHPQWRDNLAAALKLQVLLEERAPGITRPVLLRAQRFNQDLASGAMIVEVGTAGNTLEQALRSVPVLADALLQLIRGANC